MTDISTTFAGLRLKSPIIVGSSGITASIPKIMELAEAGAGAVVLKSLFEEYILGEIDSIAGQEDHPEGYDYIAGHVSAEIISSYISLIKEAKASCDIPVIASIACRGAGKWAEFASQVEEAGADALELNVMALCTGRNYKYGDFEKMHAETVRSVARHVKIPLIVKLGANMTNYETLSDNLYAAGAAAVVLFNRFYPTDIDVDNLTFTMADPLTTGHELLKSIRTTGLVSSSVPKIDVAASGGVQNAQSVEKCILAGAKAVEVVSAIIREGSSWVTATNDELAGWQKSKGFGDITSYRGRMNAGNEENLESLLRAQFIRHFGQYV